MKATQQRKMSRRMSSRWRWPVLCSRTAFSAAASWAGQLFSRPFTDGSKRARKSRTSSCAMRGLAWKALRTSSQSNRSGCAWARLVWQKATKARTSAASSPLITPAVTSSRYSGELVGSSWVLKNSPSSCRWSGEPTCSRPPWRG